MPVLLAFLCLGAILLAGEFDARLDFPDRHDGQKEFIGRHPLNSPEDAWMRMKTAQFRYHIGVEPMYGLTRIWETRGGDAVAAVASVRRCVPPA